MILNIPLGDSRGKADIIWQMLSFNHKLQEMHSKHEKSIFRKHVTGIVKTKLNK